MTRKVKGKDCILMRAVNEAEFIVETGATVRETSKVFNVSKSTVHKDCRDNLKNFGYRELWQKVREVMETNKAERAIRGGMATKKKYEQIKKEPDKLIEDAFVDIDTANITEDELKKYWGTLLS